MSTGNPVDILEPAISALKAKIEELQKAVETLEALRASGALSGMPVGSIPAAQQTGGSTFSNDAFFGMTVGDAAKKYLGGIKKTATANAIADALVAGGWKTSAKNVPDMVRTILYRTQGIVKINGEFGLAEWYPGRKVLKTRPVTSATESAETTVADEIPDEQPLEKVSEIDLP